MLKIITCVVFMGITSGCAVLTKETLAEKLSGYTYIPVDPFSVKTNPGASCEENLSFTPDKSVSVSEVPYGTLLESLPDNAVRTTVETFFVDGSVTYGASKISAKADSYRMTVDYINADTTNVDIWIKREAQNYDTKKLEPVNIFTPSHDRYSKYVPGSDIYTVTSTAPETNQEDYKNYQYFSLPVYVGIGLRATADINDVKTGANISGLGAIGISADTSDLKGSLTVQTLGVNGQAIAAALPIQSELNRTTAQNAITAVASIKALLYEKDTIVQPRVVGIYLPFPGGKALVNSIVSELSSARVVWYRPCVAKHNKSSNTDAASGAGS
ncbi:hypothetical protein PESP_a0837 [Pseudoalteromonas espejiana DSM 9414]|uniref:Uncharacterized protein n=1 Tax=Pseudoalteromonas espejiana TaxID=28107 RepID=A0A510XXQ7_9GAMM|nr:hypothetical protein [Pseudoalteromonas espejiana]ASM49032.1 hypothetical protein PESP_a0837 [Pseudoalteromonas espejiana DSM 9414]GEK55788.1 hypothetical protein PES01_26330 [Pseudoalteromonas espejiana]